MCSSQCGEGELCVVFTILSKVNVSVHVSSDHNCLMPNAEGHGHSDASVISHVTDAADSHAAM